ncbi:hypothetical protein Hdeb2414_s0530g00912101 [Helianthus debilis subsp. tardiflorus]
MARNARWGKHYQFDAWQARWRLGKEAGQTKQIRSKSMFRMQGTFWMPEDDQAQ